MVLQALEEEKRVHAKLQIQHQKLALAYADTKSQVQNDNYKIENYDRVKRYHRMPTLMFILLFLRLVPSSGVTAMVINCHSPSFCVLSSAIFLSIPTTFISLSTASIHLVLGLLLFPDGSTCLLSACRHIFKWPSSNMPKPLQSSFCCFA